MLTFILIGIGVGLIFIYTIIYYERRLSRLRNALRGLRLENNQPSSARLKAVEAARAARSRQKEEKKTRLLQRLQELGKVSFEELSDKTQLSPPTLSRYLSELHQEGKVIKETKGVRSYWKVIE